MYSLIVSLRAKERITQVSDYILGKWGTKANVNFLNELERCMRIIEQNPLAFRLNLELTEVHECVVTSHNILYYTIIDEKTVLILSLGDTRMATTDIHIFL
ncbi:type II toxin-antitoxin system RelE/ParE family toxin [Bacteroides eggerthii]|uniref:type II toxin-antitoxin system RelE/ParE family toxin n=1 Tax=Bacteroides eggerthii TaxID=28111 RepID=UPI003A4E3915